MLVSKIRTNKTRVIAGVIAAAAVAIPAYTSLTIADTAPESSAAPRCLAWFGNVEDGNCLSYSNGSGATIGTPQVGIGQGGIRYQTPMLLPGTSITQPIG